MNAEKSSSQNIRIYGWPNLVKNQIAEYSQEILSSLILQSMTIGEKRSSQQWLFQRLIECCQNGTRFIAP